MPYFITDKADGCSGWATIKSDGEIVGCHTTKSAAIKQMVAISLAEKMQPGGERALPGTLRVGDYVSWNSSGGRARGEIERIATSGVIAVPGTDFKIEASEDDPAALIRVYEKVTGGWRGTDTLVGHKFSTLTRIDDLEEIDDESDDMDDDDLDNDETRAINAKVPAYMRAAARRGLEYVADGKAGDGLKQQTINEARKMASGEISDDKWIRMAAWIARHLGDLDSPESDPQHPNYPSPGVVAHLLWGSGPSKTKARAAMQYAEGVVERIRNEQKRHLPGGHDQKSHGGGGGMNVLAGLKANKRKYSKKKRNVTLPDENFAAEVVGLDRVELVSAAMDKYGYNDKPSVSDEEFNELKNAGATVVYRGVEPKGNMTADEITIDFREGDKHFVGGGHYGQGTYTTSSKEEAKLYTGGDNNGAMMAMAIRPEAKIIDYADIEGEAFRLLNSQNDPNLQYSDGFTFLERDESATAMHLGYDVIKRQSTANETHYIILNRSAVVLPQSNEAYDE